MIKGVNRQVVEVSETGSDYFEKILFFVKAEYAGISEGKIREKAGMIARGTSAPPKMKKNRKALKEILGFVLGCLCCVALGIIIGRLA